MKKNVFLLISLFLIASIRLHAQNAKLDSLNNLLAKTTVDTMRANIMADLGWEYKYVDIDRTKKIADELLILSVKAKHQSTEAAAYNLIGIYYYLKHDTKAARENYNKGLALYIKLNNIKGIASCYSNISNLFTELAAFDSALHYQQLALKYRLQLKKDKPIADSYLNLGNIYNLKGDYSLSMDNIFKALKLYEKINDGAGKGLAYYNIGRTYYMQGKHRDAIAYVKRSRDERLKLNDNSGVATTYILEASAYEQLKIYDTASTIINKAILIQKELKDEYSLLYSYSILANIFYAYGQPDLALEYYLKSREIAERMQNIQAIAGTDYNIGKLYQDKGNYKKAVEYQLNSLKISKQIGAKEEIKKGYLLIQETYAKMKDYEKAYEYTHEYIKVNDSLLSEANINQLNELQTQYDTEKKQKEIELFRKNDEVQKEKIARQSIVTYTVIGGLLLVLVLAFISFRRYREKKKANIEITLQKEIIEEKNKEIVDSIHYAKRIQRALLASDHLLNRNLPEHFVLYKPKDIVSGDFYWATQSGDKFILATCDCTGHGVPGAFMSLLNISKLSETVNEKKITQPDLIFNEVRTEIISALNPDGVEQESRDGMDATLCAFDFKRSVLQFAAANNSLIIVRNNAIIEYKADKFPVGMHQGAVQPFTLHTVELQKGDCIYTFTDGYSDQFGGTKGKKFMSKNFKEVILSLSSLPMQQQKQEFERTFESWKNTFEQVDDVLVIGIRV